MKNFQSGTHINQGYYKSFQPNFINKVWILDDMEIITLLSKADRMLGRLDMYSEHVPNIDLFISMHVMKEATQSSKIEGTQTNIEEALLAKEDVPLDKRDDWMEVHNYINAMNEAIKMLEKLPFSSRLIRNVHKVLLAGVRGEHKQPGEFRKSQNWIGGSSINDAIFIPPVHTSIPDLMNDIDEFVHSDKLFPELLKIALIHYQFETIHPFLDGNGRTGRLILNYMLEKEGYPPIALKHDAKQDYKKSLEEWQVRGNPKMFLDVVKNYVLDELQERIRIITVTRETMKVLNMDLKYENSEKPMELDDDLEI